MLVNDYNINKVISIMQSRISNRRLDIKTTWGMYIKKLDRHFTKSYVLDNLKWHAIKLGKEQKEDKKILHALLSQEAKLRRMRNIVHSYTCKEL